LKASQPIHFIPDRFIFGQIPNNILYWIHTKLSEASLFMRENILVLNGSPRKSGNTAVLVEQLVNGARQEGAESEVILLHDLNIQACDACDYCQKKGNGCVISDDMQEIYPKLLAADSIVIASPVYWYHMTAQAKTCLDRWYALESGQDFELKGKRLSLLMVYGDSDLYTSGGITVILTLEGICRYIGMKFDGIVHGTAMDVGDAAKNPVLLEKAFQLGRALAVSV
jgi:multimeric flavodoxin WrbA